MAQDHSIPQPRYELKYLVREEVALKVRDFVHNFLQLDEFATRRPDGSYVIYSLYLDSDRLETHYAAVNGHRNRFKLRLRYYDNAPDSPLFCEVKRRSDSCIIKHRCAVRRTALPLILAGQMPGTAEVFSSEPRDLAALEHFHRHLLQLAATPKAHNVYLREAWVSGQDPSIRVNFDRAVRLEPWFEPRLVVELRRPVRLYPGFVVLELKYSTHLPVWYRELIERFNLMQTSAGKYSDGVAAMGESHFSGPRAVPRPAKPATTRRAMAKTIPAGVPAAANRGGRS